MVRQPAELFSGTQIRIQENIMRIQETPLAEPVGLCLVCKQDGALRELVHFDSRMVKVECAACGRTYERSLTELNDLLGL